MDHTYLTRIPSPLPCAGRVLKDEDALSTYKIQTSHTIHMVKGAARAAAAPGGSAANTTPQALPTMQAGQNPHDPLTQLNGPMGFGLMAGFNPFADMGLNPNDPNMVSVGAVRPDLRGRGRGRCWISLVGSGRASERSPVR